MEVFAFPDQVTQLTRLPSRGIPTPHLRPVFEPTMKNAFTVEAAAVKMPISNLIQPLRKRFAKRTSQIRKAC